MGLGSAILMIIGTLIGTGIFASPGPLFDAVHSTQTSFIIWAFAGLICTIGAYSYAELGSMFPSSGGDFNYLSRAYGRKMGLVFGWTFIMVLNPVGTSGISGVLGRYVVDLIRYFYEAHNMAVAAANGVSGGPVTGSDYYNPTPIGTHAGGQPLGANAFNGSLASGSGGSDYYWSGNDTVYGPLIFLNDTFGIDDRGHLVHLYPHSPYAPGSPVYNAPLTYPPSPETMEVLIRVFSVGAILLMGTINVFFKEGGKYASNFLAILKLAGMFLLIVIGSMAAVKNHAQSEPFQIPIEESSRNVLDYVSAFCFAFFAYNGFNNINLGLGELRDPERNLKWAVCLAMPSITVLFLLANFALFSILSSHDLRHIHSLTLHAGHKVLGTPGGYLMAATVIASALGSINANIWAGTRLLVTLANDNELIPACMAKTWSRTGTPAWAMTFLIVQASIHALIGLDFKQFSKVYSAVGWSWYGLSVLGLLYLRKTKPHLPRPVKIWYPLAIFFVAVAAFLVIGALLLAFGSRTLLHPSSATAGNGSSGDPKSVSNGPAEQQPPVEWGTVGMVIFVFVMISCSWCAIRGTQWINRRKEFAGAISGEVERACPLTTGAAKDYYDNRSMRECRHDSILSSPKHIRDHSGGMRNYKDDSPKHQPRSLRSVKSLVHSSPTKEWASPSIYAITHSPKATDYNTNTHSPRVPEFPFSGANDRMDNCILTPRGHRRDGSQSQSQHDFQVDEAAAVLSSTDKAFRHRHLHHHHSPSSESGLHHRHLSWDQQDITHASSTSVVLHPWSPSSLQNPFRTMPASLPSPQNPFRVTTASSSPPLLEQMTQNLLSLETPNDPSTPLSPLASSILLPSLSPFESASTPGSQSMSSSDYARPSRPDQFPPTE
ncbi:b(0,+)-type amino acid transporter 1 [Actinomortierella ambigua]|nr:b(0,+)-type amino acid transporter 1 [Actinomortierella ambigua]